MRSLVFTWPYAVLFWAVYIWVFTPEFRIVRNAQAGAAAPESKDAGSMKLIMLGLWVALFSAFLLCWIPSLRFPARWTAPAFWIGTTLLVLGSLLRRHCWRVLGTYFTGDVQARADQPVIDRGAYRFVRHPSYTAGILIFTAIGIALASWASLALLFVTSVIVYGYRVKVEERALVEAIGDPYVAFMRTRKRFVPYVI
jgi:protein-S-isoprenylcysteine O-methyltransferase Ste14